MLWDETDDEFWEDRWDDALGFLVPLTGKQPVSRYVIAYDIVNDRRRVKIAEYLEGWGTRMQKSVFEVVLEKAHIKMVTRELGTMINAEEDRISIYPVCAACDSRRVDLGTTVDKPENQPYLIL